MINLLFFKEVPGGCLLTLYIQDISLGVMINSGCYDKVLTLKATGKIDHTYYYEKMDQFMSVPEKGKDVSALCCGE
jgi:hypothetical protein